MSGIVLECWKCYITYVMCGQDLPDMSTLALKLMCVHIKQIPSAHVTYITYVTEFVKSGLIYASNFLTLRICNSASIGPTALKFGSRTFPSFY